MTRFAMFAFAAATIGGAANAATYSADLTNPVSEKIITRDISWNCAGTDCKGATDYGRPVVLCQSLAKKAGKVANFAVNGRSLGADKLAECNALAKDVGTDLARK